MGDTKQIAANDSLIYLFFKGLYFELSLEVTVVLFCKEFVVYVLAVMSD